MQKGTKTSAAQRTRSAGGLSLSPRTAVLVLVAAVVVVGAIGYVVLSVVSSESTHHVSSGGCVPANSPVCSGSTHTGNAPPSEIVAHAGAR